MYVEGANSSLPSVLTWSFESLKGHSVRAIYGSLVISREAQLVADDWRHDVVCPVILLWEFISHTLRPSAVLRTGLTILFVRGVVCST